MDKFVKVRAKQDKKVKAKIKKMFKGVKENQTELIVAVVAILALNNSDNPNVELAHVITKKLNNLSNDLKNAVAETLTEAYKEAYKETSLLCEVAIDYNIVNPEFVKAAIETPINGARFSERIWKNTNDLANRIYDDILECVRTGKRPDEIARKIKEDYSVTAYEAKRLVHTELAKTVTAAQKEIYRQAGVEYVLWTATLEHNTCQRCGDYDGQIFKLDDAPDLPLHPNCRCCLSPAPDKYVPKMRANNETKQNINYTTWNDWK